MVDANLRGEEIRECIENAPRLPAKHRVRRYAVLDDETEPILESIHKQNVFACDPWHGLTEEVADRVIRHFTSEKNIVSRKNQPKICLKSPTPQNPPSLPQKHLD